MKKSIILVFLPIFLFFSQTGVKKKRPLPPDFGKTIIKNFETEQLPGVEFDHWVHRLRFTCRVCHVDIGFAMVAGETKIKAEDNMRGYYCGSCHNGKMKVEDRIVFESCNKNAKKEDYKKCERCHSLRKNVKKEYDFYKITEKFPKGRFGNGIDWVKAEDEGFIKLQDAIEGVSIKRKEFKRPNDFDLQAKIEGLPEIVFSHQKHTVWMGCEGCHPEIFIGIKKGSTKYSMQEIFQGKYCGYCHITVAFPLNDCQRCHTKSVFQ